MGRPFAGQHRADGGFLDRAVRSQPIALSTPSSVPPNRSIAARDRSLRSSVWIRTARASPSSKRHSRGPSPPTMRLSVAR